jgi:hypothetical protein
MIARDLAKELGVLGIALTPEVIRLMTSFTAVGYELRDDPKVSKKPKLKDVPRGYGVQISFGATEIWTKFIIAAGIQRTVEQNPQKPSTITVPLDAERLEALMNDTLKYSDCAEYITRLINRAAEQTGKPPESTNIMGLFEKIKSQPKGGILFDRNDIPGHPEIPPVAGGGGWAWGWYPQGNAMINIYTLSYFSDNPRGASRIPYAYGERGVHEVIHLSAKGGLGYNDAELTKAARSLEPDGSFVDWDGALKNHCMPPQFR